MKTRAEINELFAAAKFAVKTQAKKNPPTVTLTKGDPPIFICAEQAMTLHLPGKRVALDVLGPVSRMAIALHLNLTPEEAALASLTPVDAQAECMAECRRIISAAMLAARQRGDHETADLFTGELFDIPPHDPRWGRTQTAAEMAKDGTLVPTVAAP